MRQIARAAALAATILALLAPNLVLAQDYVEEAVQALQSSPVYVSPGTEGTDGNTASKLRSRLTRGDNIVLVMLPAKAEVELGADPNTIATRLSEKLDNQRIIGLAVGRKVVGYAPWMPDVAADQMRKANSVSNDSVTALGTFVQNVHNWQREHPQPVLVPPISPEESGGLPWLLILVLMVVVVGIIAGLTITVNSRNAAEARVGRTHFKAPDPVSDLLSRIARERAQVRDEELKGALLQLCVDIERYFRKSSSDKRRDSLFFKERLTEVANVLAKYIEVQDSPRYYHEPQAELARGKSSILDFSQYVLESIRSGNTADLVPYRVNTNILQAQRYRAG